MKEKITSKQNRSVSKCEKQESNRGMNQAVSVCVFKVDERRSAVETESAEERCLWSAPDEPSVIPLRLGH